MDNAEEAGKGVVSGAQADLFEMSGAEEQLLADASPFRDRPQPIGGSRKGIPNRRTQAMRELYLKSGLPHPVLWMGSMLRLGVDGLAKALDCKAIEAAELLRKIAADAAPFIEGKQPLRIIDEGANKLPVVVLGDLGHARAVLAAAREEGVLAIDDDVERSLVEFQGYQALKDAERGASQALASHAAAKLLTDKDNPD